VFDKLDLVKEAWMNNHLILIDSQYNEQKHLAIPAQLMNRTSSEILRRLSYGSIYCGISFDVFRDLEIPVVETMYAGLGTRYPLLYLLNRKNTPEKENVSISFDIRDSSLIDGDEKLSRGLRFLGDIVENREAFDLTKDQFQERFLSHLISPGPIILSRSHHKLLLKKNGIAELAVAISKISNYGSAIVYSRIVDDLAYLKQLMREIGQEKLVTISAKTIIDLWRSIEKVNKSKFGYEL